MGLSGLLRFSKSKPESAYEEDDDDDSATCLEADNEAVTNYLSLPALIPRSRIVRWLWDSNEAYQASKDFIIDEDPEPIEEPESDGDVGSDDDSTIRGGDEQQHQVE